MQNRKFIIEIKVVRNIFSNKFYPDQNTIIKSEIYASHLSNFSILENFGGSWGDNNAFWKVNQRYQCCLKIDFSVFVGSHQFFSLRGSIVFFLFGWCERKKNWKFWFQIYREKLLACLKNYIKFTKHRNFSYIYNTINNDN